jgi:hypothetical protein
MKPPSQPRRTACLPESVRQQLNMYALAAGVAGVSMLALEPSAEARIVYTPAHRVIGPNMSYLLDLNHDGTADFKVVNIWASNTSGLTGSLSVFSAQKGKRNGILGYGTADKGTLVYFASALRPGAGIGPKKSFFYPKWIDWMFRASAGWGQWKNVTNRYLGFKFDVKGKAHYGWARLNVSFNPKNLKITATLTGYAYETIPNKPIIAGKTKEADDGVDQPATLGRLALGRK